MIETQVTADSAVCLSVLERDYNKIVWVVVEVPSPLVTLYSTNPARQVTFTEANSNTDVRRNLAFIWGTTVVYASSRADVVRFSP